MALIKCNNCGGMVSDKAKACPHCGVPVVTNGSTLDYGTQAQGSNRNDEPKRKSNTGFIVAVVLGVLAMVGIGGWLLYDNQQKRIALEQMQEKVRIDSIAEVQRMEQTRLDSINAAKEKIEMMQNAYKKVLSRYRDGKYFLYDITGDGVPELWLNVYEGDGESWQIHQLVDNQLILIFQAITGTCYQGKNCIIIDFDWGLGDTYPTYKVYYRNGKIIEDEIRRVDGEENHKAPSEPKIKTYDTKNTRPIMEAIK